VARATGRGARRRDLSRIRRGRAAVHRYRRGARRGDRRYGRREDGRTKRATSRGWSFALMPAIRCSRKDAAARCRRN
jgi:hypothetical protein